MTQSDSPRTYAYEMPKALPYSLVSGTTWGLFCPECGRHAYPNLVDLVARYGENFTPESLWRRATCRDCGARLKVAGGMFVKRLKQAGELHTMVMPPRTDRPAF